jgi:hypothetical protein
VHLVHDIRPILERQYIIGNMCHMRRRMHVSYEEEDTCRPILESQYIIVPL